MSSRAKKLGLAISGIFAISASIEYSSLITTLALGMWILAFTMELALNRAYAKLENQPNA